MLDSLRKKINSFYRFDETECVEILMQSIQLSHEQKKKIQTKAAELVKYIQANHAKKGGIDAFMQQYGLSNEEGIALMCVAEALLRIPDADTADRLIRDKISPVDWEKHLGKSESSLVNAATWGLMISGKIIQPIDTDNQKKISAAFKKILTRTSEPVIRTAVRQAMQILDEHFIMGSTIEKATKRARDKEKLGYLYSYDMLGEASKTAEDAQAYFNDYQKAIRAVSEIHKDQPIEKRPSISVKLSGLHPRYEFMQRERVIEELVPRLKTLLMMARSANVSIIIDAEESDKLDLSLDIFEKLYTDPDMGNWAGFGLAVQAYQKRSYYVLDWLAELAKQHRRRIMIRLVKGAYWDTEVKLCQELSLSGYPVFTRKPNTDVSYLACAQKLINSRSLFYPQFATHNAHTLASVLAMAGENKQGFEFQALHGMGEALYEKIVGPDNLNIPCRIYAPVGSHEKLLSYLVRRLLENGANTSFINRIVDSTANVEDLVRDPMDTVKNFTQIPHPKIPHPYHLYGDHRKNSHGIDISNRETAKELEGYINITSQKTWAKNIFEVGAIINGRELNKNEPNIIAKQIIDPSDNRRVLGTVYQANEAHMDEALAAAKKAAVRWAATSADKRAEYLENMADLLQQEESDLITIAIREAGKSIPAAIAEVREAIDFCRYYAALARKDFLAPMTLTGPTGELNQLSFHGRGVFLAISPWNFPLAIFTGEVAAALAAGNAVLAKPAGQTCLMGAMAVRLFHRAGIPVDVLHLIPSSGSLVGKKLVNNPDINGIVFTGSTDTAKQINQTLATRPGPIVPFIAETGGQNAMIVDSSALPEQVTQDVIRSAFDSAGQRCSALRVLFLQSDIADTFITMLRGAMAEMRAGDPGFLSTDVGPVIDEAALKSLEAHGKYLEEIGKRIYQVEIPSTCKFGHYFAPRAYEIDSIKQLKGEVFGPVLHVIRYQSRDLDRILDEIQQTEFGLTLGIHTRITETADYIKSRLRVGNAYINRNMIGAVVGVQPFGGEGLSGTGPKAGGPYYLHRFAVERCVSNNIAAVGGNASLLSLSD